MLGINWDPSNGMDTGEIPLPNGYTAVKPFIFHVHVKGTVLRDSGERVCCQLGSDDMGWHSIVRKLMDDGYDGYLSVETHFPPRYNNTMKCVKTLQLWCTETESF
jgi:sugar phosphate isomerase/epimerase